MSIIFSDLDLEQYLLGELADDIYKQIENALLHDKSLQQRVDSLRESGKQISMDYPLYPNVAIIRNAYAKHLKAGKSVKILFKKIALSFAGSIVLFLLIMPVIYISNDIGDSERSKGNPAQLFIYKKTGNSVHRLKEGATARENDILQIAFISEKQPYVMIVSVDGNNAVTLHFPDSETGSSGVVLHKKMVIPNSYTLDRAPLYEKFFMITSLNKFNIPEMLKFIKREIQNNPENPVLNLRNNKNFSISVFFLNKEK
ncbi:MAG: hypothetical protein SVZ03_03835 [Spirochaetota bacterium]|nr:hypothetical protein [Spirochaetota bacterium]